MRHSLIPRILWLLVLPLGACNQAKPVEEVTISDATFVASAPDVVAQEADWPWWRGPQHNGHAVGSAPVEWNERNNLVWKAPIPGRGHASPIICGEHVFVATADEQEQTQMLVCLDRESGRPRWTTKIHQGGFMHMHHDNSQASPTPACDGKHVYCAFMVQDGIWVTAVDLEGNIAWQSKAGDFVSQHGYGASPVLYKSLVIVSGDTSGGSFLTALRTADGSMAWRVRRDNEASFATPVVAHVAGTDQLLLSGHEEVISYNPVTGEKLWTSEGPATTTANTVAWNDELVFASGGYPQNAVMAIKADGSGEVVWKERLKGYVPSPLVIGDRLLVVQDNGVVQLLDAKTGDKVWAKRLGGNFYASPILAGGNVYVPNLSGMMFVFHAGDKFELIAENFLATGGEASPAACGGRLYIRSAHELFCVGSPSVE